MDRLRVDGRGAGVRIPFIGRRTLGCVLGTRAQRGDHGESVPRGRRAGEEGADPWGRAVSGVGRRGLSGLLRERGGETGLRLGRAELGQAGACAGSAGRPSGGVLGWLQGKGEGRGDRAGLGRRKGNGPWGKDGLGCFGFGSSFHFYFFFFCKLTQTSLNSNKFEFKLPSTQLK